MKLTTYLSISFILMSFFYANGMKKENIVDSPLIRAVKKEDYSSVDCLLEGRVDLDEKDKDGRTALMWLVIRRCWKTRVNSFLEFGADPHIQDNEGKTALMWAADTGHQNAVQGLIYAGVNLDQKDRYGKTALMWAGSRGNAKIVDALLEAGADCHLRSNRGETALTRALRRSNPCDAKCCNLLIENMMSPTSLQKGSLYTFFLCLKRFSGTQYSNLRNLFKSQFGTLHRTNLIDIGNELRIIKNAPFKKCLQGDFYSTLTGKLVKAVKNGNVKEVECLIHAGADVNYSHSDAIPLILAAYGGRKEIVECLIHAGADVNKKDSSHNVPLKWAVIFDYQAIAECLIKAGADVNHKDYDGRTLLMQAVDVGLILDITKLLIQKGANLYATDYDNRTVLFFASGRPFGAVLFCEILIEAMLEREKSDESLKAEGAHYQLNNLKDSERKSYLLKKYFS